MVYKPGDYVVTIYGWTGTLSLITGEHNMAVDGRYRIRPDGCCGCGCGHPILVRKCCNLEVSLLGLSS